MTPQSSGTMTGGDSGPGVETVPPCTLLPAVRATFKSRLGQGVPVDSARISWCFHCKSLAAPHLSCRGGFYVINTPHSPNFLASLSKSQRLLTVILSSWLE